jgi:hypothetical protein
VKLFNDEICQFVPIKTTLLEQSSQLIISNKILKKKGEQLIFRSSLDSVTITSFSIRMHRVISLKTVRYLLHFVITSNQHKTQGKEMSISYEFSIIFEILVHSGVPHMACINDYMYITLRMLSLSCTGI